MLPRPTPTACCRPSSARPGPVPPYTQRRRSDSRRGTDPAQSTALSRSAMAIWRRAGHRRPSRSRRPSTREAFLPVASQVMRRREDRPAHPASFRGAHVSPWRHCRARPSAPVEDAERVLARPRPWWRRNEPRGVMARLRDLPSSGSPDALALVHLSVDHPRSALTCRRSSEVEPHPPEGRR